jgi:hypothetical protein
MGLLELKNDNTSSVRLGRDPAQAAIPFRLPGNYVCENPG